MDAFLFDLDGTLVDSRIDIARSANHARRAVGLPERPESEIFEFIGEGAQRLIERVLGAEHADRVGEALEAWRAHYERHMLDHTVVFPGLREALAALQGQRAIVTNKPGPSARRLVEGLGLAALAPVVVGGGDVPARKPDPASVFEALRQLGPVERVVLVGDSGVDAQTARAARIGFVGVLWGLRSREEMQAAGASRFVSTPGELATACVAALTPWPAG